MARVFTDALLDDANRMLHQDRMRLTEVANELGVNADNLSRILRENGVIIPRYYRPVHNAKEFPRERAVKLYRAGMSVKKLSELFGVTRASVRAELVRQGLDPRGRSESMYLRMSQTSAKERQRLARAAHDAVRGVKRSTEELKKRARAQCKRVGPGEDILAEEFRKRGIEFIPQAPIHIYNIDLLVDRVAVEPTCKSSSPLRYPKCLSRSEYLAGRGYSTLWITYKTIDALAGCMEYVLADLDQMRRNKSAIGEYRVVRCSAHRFARGRNEKGQVTAVPAPVRYLYSRMA